MLLVSDLPLGTQYHIYNGLISRAGSLNRAHRLPVDYKPQGGTLATVPAIIKQRNNPPPKPSALLFENDALARSLARLDDTASKDAPTTNEEPKLDSDSQDGPSKKAA